MYIMTIPKIAFSFWEGTQFTYLHYLTYVTFSKHNPDFKIIVYTSTRINSDLIKWNTGEHDKKIVNTYDFYKLSTIPNLEIIHIDIEKELQYDHPLSSVWKSDIVRIVKLYEHGGIYIDFDTMFINKVDESLFNLNFELGCNTYFNVINNAFLIAKPKSYVVKNILDALCSKLQSNNITNEYQQFGPTLVTDIILHMQLRLQHDIYFIPNEMTCPYLCNEMDKLFHSNIVQYTDKTFCIHWYNGNPISREYCSSFSIETIDETRNNFELLLSHSIKIK